MLVYSVSSVPNQGCQVWPFRGQKTKFGILEKLVRFEMFENLFSSWPFLKSREICIAMSNMFPFLKHSLAFLSYKHLATLSAAQHRGKPCTAPTFVLVRLGLDAEDGDDHNDDDDGGGGEGHNEPGLPVEGLGLQVPVLEIHFRRGRDLKKANWSLFLPTVASKTSKDMIHIKYFKHFKLILMHFYFPCKYQRHISINVNTT